MRLDRLLRRDIAQPANRLVVRYQRTHIVFNQAKEVLVTTDRCRPADEIQVMIFFGGVELKHVLAFLRLLKSMRSCIYALRLIVEAYRFMLRF